MKSETDRLDGSLPSPGLPEPSSCRDSDGGGDEAELSEDGSSPFRRPGSLRKLLFLGGLMAVMGFFVLLAFELRTFWLQSLILTDFAEEISFSVDEGPSSAIRFPTAGPYDERLGYTRIPAWEERLHARGFETTAQARLSDRHLGVIDRGLFPVYVEKAPAGLRITDRLGHPVFVAEYPDRTFSTFEEIPSILVRTLLYIENRDLLDPDVPYRNPALEWDRLARAGLSFGLRALGSDRPVPGGSTLATQIEKFRHSPRGVTDSPGEKLRQIATASLRVYREGRNTLDAQRGIVRDYLNSVPLSGIVGYGEVNGLRTGLRAWYGMDPETVVTRLVQAGSEHPPGGERARLERGRAYRAVLSLLLAQSRPSYYLGTPEGRTELSRRADDYLEALSRDAVVPPELARTASQVAPALRLRAPAEDPVSFVDRKGANVLRAHLLGVLQEDRLYELDRFDANVESTLDQAAQVRITEELRRLADPEYVATTGLAQPRLLSGVSPGDVVYTFLLLEATERGNLVRVQTDNFEGPFDLNQGAKLELGSTAKLRTLVTYLEIMKELHGELAELEPPARDSLVGVFDDPLTRWVRDWLRANPGGGLSELLSAALERRYSASPNERFYTGGGTHTFSNFDDTYDSSVLSVSTGFRQSVNLVFIRLMRDVVRYEMLRIPGSSARVLDAGSDEPVRREYLRRFADREGSSFVRRFYAQLQDAAGRPDALVDELVGGAAVTPLRLARIYRGVNPKASRAELTAFLVDRTPSLSPSSSSFAPSGTRTASVDDGQEVVAAVEEVARLDEDTVEDLYRRTSPEGVSWPDLGYLAGVHPLELWVARYLAEHPSASRSDALAASEGARQEVYRWLFTTSRRSAQDRRIETMLELEAFESISRRWQRLGYPFAQLVPSYASAIGSSGDRPIALAELVGIVLNDGVRLPVARVEELRFAESTPYETTLTRIPDQGTRVMPSEVALAVRGALRDVVENGTARRVFGALTHPDGTLVPIGGKTGTGDNRSVVVGPMGNVIESRVVNRTSTFVFFLGDRFFGVVSAYVEGPEAGAYRFTSALPTQILRRLVPNLEDLVF